MEIKYCSLHIDINYISCNSDELLQALIELQKNCSYSERITIYIADKKVNVYIYYKNFSGIRIISLTKCETIYELDNLLLQNPRQFKNGWDCTKMYNYINYLLKTETKEIVHKEIHFYCEYEDIVRTYSYQGTLNEIDRNEKIIRTTSLANLSFDLIDKGYNIYLHKNDKVFKLKPGMILNSKKLRKEHNLLKMLLSGCFD